MLLDEIILDELIFDICTRWIYRGNLFYNANFVISHGVTVRVTENVMFAFPFSYNIVQSAAIRETQLSTLCLLKLNLNSSSKQATENSVFFFIILPHISKSQLTIQPASVTLHVPVSQFNPRSLYHSAFYQTLTLSSGRLLLLCVDCRFAFSMQCAI